MLAQNLTPLILLGILMFGIIGGINILFQHDNLNNIKSRTVGDGSTAQPGLLQNRKFIRPITLFHSSRNSGGGDRIFQKHRALWWAADNTEDESPRWWIRGYPLPDDRCGWCG